MKVLCLFFMAALFLPAISYACDLRLSANAEEMKSDLVYTGIVYMGITEGDVLASIVEEFGAMKHVDCAKLQKDVNKAFTYFLLDGQAAITAPNQASAVVTPNFAILNVMTGERNGRVSIAIENRPNKHFVNNNNLVVVPVGNYWLAVDGDENDLLFQGMVDLKPGDKFKLTCDYNMCDLQPEN